MKQTNSLSGRFSHHTYNLAEKEPFNHTSNASFYILQIKKTPIPQKHSLEYDEIACNCPTEFNLQQCLSGRLFIEMHSSSLFSIISAFS